MLKVEAIAKEISHVARKFTHFKFKCNVFWKSALAGWSRQ